jgi:hypothetical protein
MDELFQLTESLVYSASNRNEYQKQENNVSGESELLTTNPEVRVRFPALPDFLRSTGSGTGATQPREYN